MDIKRYLERINYSGDLIPTIEVLNELQSAHLLNIPFENIDIHYKIKIDLLNTYDKIVNHKRGGFCYELNGLFYRLLRGTGFNVKMVSARVYNTDGDFGAEFDHMALIVKIVNNYYLTDVGFGDFSFYPLKIEFNKEIADKCGKFKFEKYNRDYYIIKRLNDKNEFIPQYLFSENERILDDFYEMCIYHQMSPDSHFTGKLICSKLTKNGRITISGNKLKISDNGIVIEQILKTEKEILCRLKELFNVVPCNI
ncbi:MAG: arylamine N-acetyltransferase [Ignavibacteria bacterium]|nr:arylamine N-acetyltransferase [Ignavibacteria bacterium]